MGLNVGLFGQELLVYALYLSVVCRVCIPDVFAQDEHTFDVPLFPVSFGRRGLVLNGADNVFRLKEIEYVDEHG